MNLTPLGVFHTILSLVAVVSALAALITHHGIAPRSGVGRVYIWSLVATCLTGLPIFRHGAIGPPHIVGVRTLATFAVAAIAARQRFLEDWSDEALYWYGMALRWSDANVNATTRQVVGSIPAPAFLRPLVGALVRRNIRGQALAQGLARLPLETVVDELGRRFDELVMWLGDRPYFFSDRPSVADLAIFGQLNMLQSGPTPQAERLIAQRPKLADYFLRLDAATAEQGVGRRAAGTRGADVEATARGA